ncbi:hypothetical protein [Bradyrhizobium sp. CCBAU 51765]|uniref:hypothetical protein n=1 Tax=Bradyrhizobium sp. CCBAU 51765 TaxID=1325102 RepID=UPI001887730D|nr:hypothetical protein [Bradyrhizobium sp. CCBAU 51765]QOZ06676.1 hypothetical protein XH96_03435 [Bradyrhizobium sp. CCBAU 51765]
MAKQVDMSEVWPTPALFRAARGLLNMGQDELAARNGYVRKTVILIENHVDPTMDTRRQEVVEVLAAFLEGQGIEFIRPQDGKGGGVRFANGKREAQTVSEVRHLIEERRGSRRKAVSVDARKKAKKKPSKRKSA